MSAIGVELSRFWHRRSIRILMALALLGTLVTLGFAVKNALPPSAADQAEAQAQVDSQINDPNFQQMMQECRESVAAQSTGDDSGAGAPSSGAEAGSAGSGEAGSSGSAASAPAEGPDGESSAEAQYPPDFDCDQMLPKAEWYLNWQKPDLVRDFANNLQAVTMLITVLFAFAAITFIGADFASGTIGTQLLYQPRRTAVFSAKAAALAIVALIAGGVGAALAWGVSFFTATRWGTTEMVDKIQHYEIDGNSIRQFTEAVDVTGWTLVIWCVRAAVLVALAVWGAYSLATLFRSSMVATAVLAAYGIMGEAILSNLIHGLRPYLLSARIQAWLHGPTTIVNYPTCNGPNMCLPTVDTVSVAGGGIYLAILVAIGLLLAAWAFARRDVE